MEHRLLGRTGVAVSALGLGGAPAGLTNYLGRWSADAAESRQAVALAVARAVDLGVTYFDTAPGYGGGISEEIFGGALRPVRQRVFLATKTSRPNWNATGVRQELERSLRRLATDHVDLLQFHGSWFTTAEVDQIIDGGVLEAYERLREEGKVRFLGFTAEGPNGPAERLIATGRFDTLMICFNFTHQSPGAFRNRETPPATLLSLAKAQHMGVVTMRTLSSGLFQRWLNAVAPAASTAIDWNAALLGYTLSHPQVDVALVGVRSVAEVQANVRTVQEGRFRLDMAALHDAYGTG